MSNDGLRGFPLGGKVFEIERNNEFRFGGNIHPGQDYIPWMTLDEEMFRRMKTLWAGDPQPTTVNVGQAYYSGFTDGSTDPYQVPSGKTFQCIGAYVSPSVTAAGDGASMGAGSSTSAPGLSWSTSVPGSPVSSHFARWLSPTSGSTFLPSVAYTMYWIPFFGTFTSSRYPFAILSHTGAVREPGSIMLHGYEIG